MITFYINWSTIAGDVPCTSKQLAGLMGQFCLITSPGYRGWKICFRNTTHVVGYLYRETNKFAVLTRNGHRMVTPYQDGTDPLYGHGSWDLVQDNLSSREEAEKLLFPSFH